MTPRMVVLLVDALGWTLAQRTQGFMPSLPHRRRLETILGFSTGALPTLFTGRMPCEHGRLLMYRRARGASVFRGFGWLSLVPAPVRRSGALGRWLARAVAARGVRGYFSLYDVPRPLLPAFDLAERDDIFAAGGLPVDSLWDSLERRGARWRGWNWRTPEAENLAALERRIAEGDERLLFCYTADLDAALHHEGSGGEGVRRCLERYQSAVGRLERAAAARGQALWIYVLSDHGMVDVTRAADLMDALHSAGLRWPRDCVAFFDSTMARFWWKAPGARARVRAVLEGSGAGRWLGAEELARAGARSAVSDYGEDIFLLDPGVLLVPSFMGDRRLAAMHGYDPSHPDMAALLWSNRPVPEPVRHLKDVRAYLESELDAQEGEVA